MHSSIFAHVIHVSLLYPVPHLILGILGSGLGRECRCIRISTLRIGTESGSKAPVGKDTWRVPGEEESCESAVSSDELL